ncbi:MAG: hypothetical protein MJH08_12790 [Hyphomicrobiales bacterium]|nr:hypothetical protein [Hyphomicrobiales bacterium]
MTLLPGRQLRIFTTWICIVALAIQHLFVSHQAQAQSRSDLLERVERDLRADEARLLTSVEALNSHLSETAGHAEILAWFRNNISIEDYPGSLRGPNDVLRVGAANPLDVSILLAEILRARSYSVRLQRGRIEGPREQQAIAPEGSFRKMSVEALPPFLTRPNEKLGPVIRRQASILATAIRSRPNASSTLPLYSDPGHEHWWLQVKPPSSPDWIALDVLSDTPGAAISTAEDTIEIAQEGEILSAIPSELRHYFILRVVAEYALGGKLTQKTMLEAEIFPAELGPERGISLAFVAEQASRFKSSLNLKNLITASKLSTSWTPVLTIGATKISGRKIGLKEDGQRAPRGAVGLGGALGGLAQQIRPSQRSNAGDLVALHLNYEVREPGKWAVHHKRVLFDIVSSQDRLSGNIRQPSSIALSSRPSAMTMSTQILPQVGIERPVLLEMKGTTWLRNLIEANVSENTANRGQLLASGGRPLGLELFAAARSAWSPVAEQVKFAHLNIVSQHLIPSTQSAGVDVYFDIVENRVTANADQFETSIAQGVADTLVEFVLLPGSEPASNTAAMFDRPDRSGETWIGVGSKSSAIDAGYESRLTSQWVRLFEAGDVVLAAGNRDLDVYWQIDPVTGATLGIGVNGWGSTVSKTIVEANALQTLQFYGQAATLLGTAFGMVAFCIYGPSLEVSLSEDQKATRERIRKRSRYCSETDSSKAWQTFKDEATPWDTEDLEWIDEWFAADDDQGASTNPTRTKWWQGK